MIFKTFEKNIGKIGIGANFSGFADFFKKKSGFSDLNGNILSDSDVKALQNYNAQLAQNIPAQNAFNNTLLNASQNAQIMAQSTNGAAVQLQAITKISKAAEIGMKAFSMALNVAVFFAVAKGIQFVSQKISDYIHKNEILIEKSNKAAESIKSISDTLKGTQSTIKDTAQRFAELSQGVDSLSGENKSLTPDDYQEFLDLSNQLAELFPALSRHYNENGDAIVDLSGNVDTIVGSLNDLVEAERNVANQKIVDQMPDLYKGLKVQSDAYKEEIDNLKSQRDSYIQMQNDIRDAVKDENVSFTDKSIILRGSMGKINEQSAHYERILLENGIDYDTVVDYSNNLEIVINESEKRIEDAFNLLQKTCNDEIESLNTDIAAKTNANSGNWNKLSQSISAWLQTDETYLIMADDMQAIIQKTINNLDFSNMNFSSFDELINYIQDNIISKLYKTSDGLDTLNEIKLTLSAQTKFNNSEIDINEYHEKINDLLQLISGLDPETQKAIKLLFGIEEDKNIPSDIDALIENVKNKVEYGFKHKVGELTFEELEIAANLDIPKGTLLSWDNLKEKIAQVAKESEKTTELSKSGMIDLINSMSDGFDVLDKIYADVKDGDVFDFTNLDTKKFKEAFSDLEEEYTAFIEKVSSSPNDLAGCQDAFNDLTKAWLDSKGVLKNLTDETANLTVAMLKNMGVANAEEIVSAELTAQHIAHKLAIEDLDTANEEAVDSAYAQIDAMINEGEASGIACTALYELIAQENIFSNNNLSVSGKVAELEKLAKAFGITADAAAMANDATIRMMRHGGASDEDIEIYFRDKYQSAIEKQFGNIRAKYSGADTSNKSSSSGSGKDSSSSKDAWLKEYEDNLKKLENLRDKGTINEREFFDQSETLLNHYLKNSEENIQKYSDKISEAEKQLHDDWIAAYESESEDIAKAQEKGLLSVGEYYQKMVDLRDEYYNNDSAEISRLATEIDAKYGIFGNVNLKNRLDVSTSDMLAAGWGNLSTDALSEEQIELLNKYAAALDKVADSKENLIGIQDVGASAIQNALLGSIASDPAGTAQELATNLTYVIGQAYGITQQQLGMMEEGSMSKSIYDILMGFGGDPSDIATFANQLAINSSYIVSSVDGTIQTVKEHMQSADLFSSVREELELLKQQANAQEFDIENYINSSMGSDGLYAQTYSNDNATVVVTPILPDGKVLSPEELQKYADKLLKGEEIDANIKLAMFEGKDAQKQAKEFVSGLDDIEKKYKELKKRFSENPYGDFTEEEIEAMEKLSEEIDGILDKYSSELGEVKSAYDELCEIRDTYNEYGKISVDQYQTLCDMGFEYLALLGQEGDSLNLDKDAFQRLANAKAVDMQITLAYKAIDMISNLNSEADAARILAVAYQDEANSLLAVAEAHLQVAVAAAKQREIETGEVGLGAAAETIYNGWKAALNLMPKIDIDMKSGGGYGDKKENSTNKEEDKKDDEKEEKEEKEQEKQEKQFNWIGTLLDRISTKTSKIIDKIDKFYTWQKKNMMINRSVKATDNEITQNQLAYQAYIKKANAVGLDRDYIKKIQEGSLSVDFFKYVDSDATHGLIKKIEKYQEWWDLAKKCLDTIDDLYDRQRELIRQKLDNILDYYSELDAYMSSITAKMESFMSLNESMGKRSSLTELVDQFSKIAEQIALTKTNEVSTTITDESFSDSERVAEEVEKARKKKEEQLQSQLDSLSPQKSGNYTKLLNNIEKTKETIAKYESKGWDQTKTKQYEALQKKLKDYYDLQKVLDENATSDTITNYERVYKNYKKLQDKLDSGKTLTEKEQKNYDKYAKELWDLKEQGQDAIDKLEVELAKVKGEEIEDPTIDKLRRNIENIEGSVKNSGVYKSLVNSIKDLEDQKKAYDEIGYDNLTEKQKKAYDKMLQQLNNYYAKKKDLDEASVISDINNYSKIFDSYIQLQNKIDNGETLSDKDQKKYDKYVDQMKTMREKGKSSLDALYAELEDTINNPVVTDADKVQEEIDKVQKDLEDTAIYQNLMKSISINEEKLKELDKIGYDNLTKSQKKTYDKLQAQLEAYYEHKKALDENATADSIAEYEKVYVAWKKLEDKKNSGKVLSASEWKKYELYTNQLEKFSKQKLEILNALNEELEEALNPSDKLQQIEKTYEESSKEIYESYQKQIDSINGQAINTKQYQDLLAKAKNLEQKKQIKGLSKSEQAALDKYNAELEALRTGANGDNISEYIKTWEAWYKLDQKIKSGKKLSASESSKYDTYKAQLEAWNKEKQTEINDLLSMMEDDLEQLKKKYAENVSDAESEIADYYANLYDLAKQIAEYNITNLQAQLEYLERCISYYQELASLYENFSGDKLTKLLSDLDEDALMSQADLYEKYLTTLKDKYSNTLSEMDEYNQLLDALDTNDFEASMAVFDKAMKSYQESGDTAMVQKLQSVLDLLNERAIDADNWGEFADLWENEWTNALLEAKQELVDTASEIQNIEDALRNVRFKPIVDAITELERSSSILSSISGLIRDDWLFDDGELSEYGRAKVALLVGQLEDAQTKANEYLDLYNKIQENRETYASDEAYEEDLYNATQNYYDALNSAAGLESAIIDLMKKSAQEELNKLKDIIQARKEALQKKKEYYDYDKTIRNSQKEIDALKAQIAAIEELSGAQDAATKARLAQLKSDLADKEEALEETKNEHTLNLQIDALDEFAKTLTDALDDSTKSLEEIMEDQKNIINDAKDLYQTSTDSVNETLEKLVAFYKEIGTTVDGSDLLIWGNTDNGEKTNVSSGSNEEKSDDIQKSDGIDVRNPNPIIYDPDKKVDIERLDDIVDIVDDGFDRVINDPNPIIYDPNQEIDLEQLDEIISLVTNGFDRVINDSNPIIYDTNQEINIERLEDIISLVTDGFDRVIDTPNPIIYDPNQEINIERLDEIITLITDGFDRVVINDPNPSIYDPDKKIEIERLDEIKDPIIQLRDIGVSGNQTIGKILTTANAINSYITSGEIGMRISSIPDNQVLVSDTNLCRLVNESMADINRSIANIQETMIAGGSADRGIVINQNYGSMLTVNGNIDKNTLPKVEQLLEQAYQYTMQRMYKDIRKAGNSLYVDRTF